MGSDSNSSPSPSPSPSSASTSNSAATPNAKRNRDLEDEVYVDNLRSHKRYLSEIMASSLNGLTVGDPLPENLMESPARSETMFSIRDDMSIQYSPMSEDSDDSRFCDNHINTCSSQPESLPTSPVSPYRYQRPPVQYGCTMSGVTYTQPRQRGSDSEGRFPSSPSDICHSADLRRAALLRSVQMRSHPPGSSPFELPYGPGHEPLANLEAEERPCSYLKSLVDGKEYQIEDCSSMGIAEPEYNNDKSCSELDIKKHESEG